MGGVAAGEDRLVRQKNLMSELHIFPLQLLLVLHSFIASGYKPGRHKLTSGCVKGPHLQALRRPGHSLPSKFYPSHTFSFQLHMIVRKICHA